MKLKVGDTAPDFTLFAFDGKDLKKISLQDYRGGEKRRVGVFRLCLHWWLNARNESSRGKSFKKGDR